MNFGNFKPQDFVLPFATLLGSVSLFPEASQGMKKLTQNRLVQYFLLFVLCYQGGGASRIDLSLMATGLLIILLEGLKMMEAKHMM